MERNIKLANGEVYHIFSRSIANYTIFNKTQDYDRMLQLFQFYQIEKPPSSFSRYLRLPLVQSIGFQAAFNAISRDQEKIIQIIAYCLMPTHIHLILKQLKEGGISKFMGEILNSYSRYFNLTHLRKGPLWESRFQNVLVDNDDQLFHLTRYLHLNPVTAYLCEDPIDWNYSSFAEYIGKPQKISYCQFDDLFEISPRQYQWFVKDQIGYQRELSKIKKLILE